MRSSRVITAVDSHTEGMPTRVVTGVGVPQLTAVLEEAERSHPVVTAVGRAVPRTRAYAGPDQAHGDSVAGGASSKETGRDHIRACESGRGDGRIAALRRIVGNRAAGRGEALLGAERIYRTLVAALVTSLLICWISLPLTANAFHPATESDKALIGAALVGLSLLDELWWWVTVLVLVREIGVTLLRFFVRNRGLPSCEAIRRKNSPLAASNCWTSRKFRITTTPLSASVDTMSSMPPGSV